MTKLQDVIDTIKEIECPVDQWQNKVRDAYREYASNDEYEISISREPELDSGEASAYAVHTSDTEHEEVVVLVSEGSEHYVANIEDAYVK